jgi:hypothetical protein
LEGPERAAVIAHIAEKIYHSVIDSLPDDEAIKLAYFRNFLTLPNLKHPRTFNEKVAWRKLHQHNPQFPIFSDKIAVKREIANIIGEQHIIETLWEGSEADEIPFESLEPPYVIKVNHSTGGNVFIRIPQDIKRDEIVASMRDQLGYRHGYRHREWAYSGIPHKVLVERMIVMPDGGVPHDYKFFTYHGRVHFIQLDCGRFRKHRRKFYDREWNPLPLKMRYPEISEPVPAPVTLPQMINLAEKIGAQFDFVRVDLYSAPSGILFGETTFYPGAGVGHFSPRSWDLIFGVPWKL